MSRNGRSDGRLFRVERRWGHDGALEFILHPLDFGNEVARLASIAEHGAQLAELIDFARSPLEADENPREPDPVLEAAMARQVEADEALRAEVALMASAPPLSRGPELPRRYRVDVRNRQVLTASGKPIEGGWKAYQEVAKRRGWDKPMTFRRPTTAAAKPRLPRRYRVDFERREVLTASGEVIPHGWPLAVEAARGVLFLPVERSSVHSSHLDLKGSPRTKRNEDPRKRPSVFFVRLALAARGRLASAGQLGRSR